MAEFVDLLKLIFQGGNIALFGAGLALIMAGIGSARGVGMVGEMAAGIVS